MHWYSNLYLGERLKNQEAKVKKQSGAECATAVALSSDPSVK